MQTEECSRQYVEFTWNTTEKHDGFGYLISDIIKGTGFLERTILFIGTYPSYISYLTYPLGIVYFFTIISAYFVYFLYIVIMVGNYLRNKPFQSNASCKLASSAVFAVWDFSTCSRYNMELRQEKILNEFKLISKEMQEDEGIKLSSRNRFATGIKLIIAKILVAIVTFGSWLIVAKLTIITNWSYSIKENESEPNSNDSCLNCEPDDSPSSFSIDTFLLSIAAILAVSFLNSLFPMIYNSIAKLENYPERKALKLLARRLVSSRISSLGVLVIIEFFEVSKSPIDPDDCNTGITCWETNFGQQIYSLMFIDTLTSLTTSLIKISVFTPFLFISKSFLQNYLLDDFDVAIELMDCIHLQIVTWTGMIVIPLLPLISSLMLLIRVSFKIFFCLLYGRTSKLLFRASGSSILFISIVASSFVTAIIDSFLILLEFPSSRSCSPFRGLHVPSDVMTYISDNLQFYPILE